MDKDGNELWRRTYDHIGEINASSYDPDTKCHILVGYKLTYNPFRNHAHIWITDSVGEVVQNKTLVSRASFSNISRLNDGSFIACGSKDTKQINEDIELMKPLLVKFDIDANIIWQTEYGTDQFRNGFQYLEVLSGDTIVTAGVIDTMFTYGLPQGLPFQMSILLNKLSPNGTTIWSRMIDVDDAFAEAGNCTGLTRATNGGYAMTVSTENFVLIKVDEYGCIEEGCQENDVGITDPKDVARLFRVYPNPAKEYAIFEFRGDFGGQAQIELQNIAGQVVDRFELRSSQYQYPVSNLEQGVYLATLKVDGKKVATEKVIILK